MGKRRACRYTTAQKLTTTGDGDPSGVVAGDRRIFTLLNTFLEVAIVVVFHPEGLVERKYWVMNSTNTSLPNS